MIPLLIILFIIICFAIPFKIIYDDAKELKKKEKQFEESMKSFENFVDVRKEEWKKEEEEEVKYLMEQGKLFLDNKK